MKHKESRHTNTARVLVLLIFFAAFTNSDIAGQEYKVSQFDTIEYTLDDNLGLFDSDEIMNISLEFDMTTLIKDKSKEEYLDAVITFYLSSTDSISQNIRLKSRGNMRNEICNLPPIRLNFRSKNEEGEEIVTNMKLVTHCNRGNQFETYLLKEYLAYKLYNVASEMSFKVRLVKIRYTDTGPRGLDEINFGILIEPVAMLAKRLNLTEMEDIVVRQDFVDPYSLDKLALFQYMIGNSDWDLPSLHNVKLFKSNDISFGMAYIVPYDFDYSGLVNTHYAAPNTKYNTKFVTERIYMGPCRDDNSLELIQDEFLRKRDEFFKVFEDFEFLDEKRMKPPVKYIESFFDSYNKGRLKSLINLNCLPRL